MRVILGICGSLRRGSISAALLRAYEDLAPPDMIIEPGRINDLPLYNEDLRRGSGFPGSVQRLREQIRYADGVLIATPECNYSVPGGLKNAIDWASRPPRQPFFRKPVALVGASESEMGTARAQYQLKQCFALLNASVLSRPEVAIQYAYERFDAHGRLIDPHAKEVVARHVYAFRHLVHDFDRDPA